MLCKQESIELVYLTFPFISLTDWNQEKFGGKKRQCSGNKFYFIAANNSLTIR